MSPRVDVDLAYAISRAEQLDPARAVDEVEEDELAHVAPARARGRRRASSARPFSPGSSGSAAASHGGDLVAVVKALGQAAHGGESRGTRDERPPGRFG